MTFSDRAMAGRCLLAGWPGSCGAGGARHDVSRIVAVPRSVAGRKR